MSNALGNLYDPPLLARQDEAQFFAEIAKARGNHEAVALAVVTASMGSAPRKAGAKMLVWRDGSISGSVGGGAVEAEVIAAARECLDNGGQPRTIQKELNEENGLVCGGSISIYIEPFLPRPALVVVGAGHVGKALTALAGFCGFHTTVIDDRPELANHANIPWADDFRTGDFVKAIAGVRCGAETRIVIATRGHEHDYVSLVQALKTPAPYVGVVGSRKKRSGFFKALLDEGFAPEDLDRVHLPVGLAIGSDAPEEIAVSIMAQIIQRKNHGKSSGSCPASGSGTITAHAGHQAVAANSG